MIAESMPGDKEKCLEAGMDDYIAKPIRIEELKQVLRLCQPLSESVPIDRKMLNQLRNMAGERTDDIIKVYLEDSLLRLDDMKKSIENNEPDQLRQAAHALRSSSGNLGATNLWNLCEEIEAIARQGTIEGTAQKMYRLRVEYSRVCDALHKELDRFPRIPGIPV